MAIMERTPPRRWQAQPQLQPPEDSQEGAVKAGDEDEAPSFQAQMERALASGQNPFLDRRREAMRDVSNESASFNRSQDLSRGLKQESSIDLLTPPRKQNAASTSVRQPSSPPSPIGKWKDSHPPMQQSAPQPQPQKLASPPIELFTPQRKMLSSEAHAVPLSQQEELHRIRTELRECKAGLRTAQLEAERCRQSVQEAHRDAERCRQETAAAQQEAARWEREAQSVKAEKEQVSHRLTLAEAQVETERVAFQAERYADRRRAWKDRMAHDEHVRQLNISAVVARNEITYHSARRNDVVKASERMMARYKKRKDDGRQALESQLEEMRCDVKELRADRKETTKLLLKREEDFKDTVEHIRSLQKNLDDEIAERKKIAEREAELRKNMKELQAVVPREAALREKLTELKASLRSEKEKAKEAAAAHKATAKVQAVTRKPSSDERTEGEVRPKTKPKPRAQPLARKTPSSEEMEREDRATSPSLLASARKRKATAEGKRKAVVEVIEDDVDEEEEPEEEEEGDGEEEEEEGTPSPPPAALDRKRKATSSKKAAAAPEMDVEELAETTAATPMLRKRSAATTGVKKGAAAAAKSGEVVDMNGAAPVQKSTTTRPKPKASVKVPVRATKTTTKAAEEGPEEEEEAMTPRMPAAGRRPKSTGASAAAAAELSVSATPFVAIEPQKKKRKLLKQGTNVATDFLTWKGDAEGGLNPQLNLPIELSPLKPAEGVQGGARLGGGSMAGAHLFGRK